MPDRFTPDWVNGGTGRRPESPPETRVERPWAISAEAVAAVLATDPPTGLTTEEAADRLHRVGPNDLVERGRKPAWRLLAEQFANTMIVVLNAVVGFVQEYRAEQAMAAAAGSRRSVSGPAAPAGRCPPTARRRRSPAAPVPAFAAP
jgi:magnesium-transporting ATPase (P-type)